MAEEPKQTEEPIDEPMGGEPQGTEPTGGQPAGKEPEPKGAPDPNIAASKYKEQRDEAKAEVERLKGQLEDLKSKGDIDEVRKESQSALEAAEEKVRKAESDRVNAVRLAQAGCQDIEVALMLLDDNGDVDALKESKPYLFEKKQTGKTGLPPEGGTSDKDKKLEEARRVSGVRRKEK